jgi:hypothetical protein
MGRGNIFEYPSLLMKGLLLFSLSSGVLLGDWSIWKSPSSCKQNLYCCSSSAHYTLKYRDMGKNDLVSNPFLSKKPPLTTRRTCLSKQKMSYYIN